jgi:hypothetical protein
MGLLYSSSEEIDWVYDEGNYHLTHEIMKQGHAFGCDQHDQEYLDLRPKGSNIIFRHYTRFKN